VSRKEALEENARLKKENEELLADLAKYRDSDPEAFEQMKEEINVSLFIFYIKTSFIIYS
jgi:hypothetical protein